MADSLDFQAIVDLVGDKLREVLHTDTLGIRWYDDEAGACSFLYEVERGQRIHPAPRQIVPGGPVEQLSRTRQPLLYPTREAMRAAGLLRVGAEQCLSAMRVPIVRGERMVAFISLENYEREQAYGEAELRLVEHHRGQHGRGAGQRAAVQGDTGGAAAADRHRRRPGRHQPLARRRRAGARRHRSSSAQRADATRCWRMHHARRRRRPRCTGGHSASTRRKLVDARPLPTPVRLPAASGRASRPWTVGRPAMRCRSGRMHGADAQTVESRTWLRGQGAALLAVPLFQNGRGLGVDQRRPQPHGRFHATRNRAAADLRRPGGGRHRATRGCSTRRSEALERQTATTEVLQRHQCLAGPTGSRCSRPSSQRASRLCAADGGGLWLADGDRARFSGGQSQMPEAYLQAESGARRRTLDVPAGPRVAALPLPAGA